MGEIKRYTLRINNSIFKRVEKRASENKRSIAKEMEYMLEKQIKSENDNQ